MELILIIFFSYLVGSIPFGYILTKFFLKKDIREIGSGNIGATNALRTGNKIIGYSTLALDIFKAILPLIFVNINFPNIMKWDNGPDTSPGSSFRTTFGKYNDLSLSTVHESAIGHQQREMKNMVYYTPISGNVYYKF